MAEIKISELSIGDWVEIDGAVTKVWYLSEDSEVNDTTYDWVKPIPLTAEILEKNGWKFDKTSRWYVYDVAHDTCVSVWLGKKEQSRIEVSVRSGSFDFYYNHADFAVVKPCVHQLQHALRLAGVGKEIEV